VDGLRCGAGFLLDAPVRYEVTIEIKAAYDPLEITNEDLDTDLKAEMKKILMEFRGGGAESSVPGAPPRPLHRLPETVC